jgi:uncharacterized protein involved in exopolysaccharide biosynthesis
MLMELIKNIEMTKMTLNQETPFIQVIDNPVLPLPVDRPNKFNFMLMGTILSILFSLLYLTGNKILRGL